MGFRVWGLGIRIPTTAMITGMLPSMEKIFRSSGSGTRESVKQKTLDYTVQRQPLMFSKIITVIGADVFNNSVVINSTRSCKKGA